MSKTIVRKWIKRTLHVKQSKLNNIIELKITVKNREEEITKLKAQIELLKELTEKLSKKKDKINE